MKKIRFLIPTLLISLLALAFSGCGEHEHTPADAVKENEVAATHEESGSYDEVVYCSDPACGAEISRIKRTTPRIEPEQKEVYEITFDVDGVKTTISVEEGGIPVFTGSTDKAPSNSFVYIFDGWDKEIIPAGESTTYVAQYKRELREYTVSFVADGEVIATTKLHYNDTIHLPNNMTQPQKKGAILFMWKNLNTKCKADTTCEAVYAWGDRDSLNWAFNYEIIKYSGIYDGEEDTDARANAFLYLTVSENKYHSDAVRDRALLHIRSLITGGQEPSFTAGPFWHYATVSLGLMLARYTPTIWDELTADEKDRIDLLMQCYAVATAFVADDENDYKTGISLMGNHYKGWNPNHRLAMTLPIVASTVYFSYGGASGAEYVNNIFLNFDYDAFIGKFEQYGFTRIKTCWSTEGYDYGDGTKSPGAKELLTNGGNAVYATQNPGGDLIGLELGASLGSGRGVKGNSFTYYGIPLTNLAGIVEHMYRYTYSGGAVISDSSSMEGGVDAAGNPLAYIIDGTKSPVEGEIGMMYEMISGDGAGIRSAITYCSHDLMLVVQSIATLEIVGAYEHNEESDLFRMIWVGNTDTIYKYSHGYHGYSLGQGSDYYDNETSKYTPWKTYWLSEYADAYVLMRDISYEMSVGSSNDLVYEYEYKESASQTVTLAKPESTIASFVGWYFDAAFTKSEYNGLRIEDGKLLIPAGYSAPIMLFAKFELPENYAYINYPLDVNLPLDAPSSFEIGTTVALPTPTKAGYIFRGWYTDAALTQPITEINSSITSDVTLYAKWSLIYLEEDFSATVSTPVTLGGNIGNLLVNGNNASSSYTANNGHLVWASTAGWGFVYTSNPAIMKSSSNLVTLTLSLARPDGENVAPIYLRVRDASKNDLTIFSLSSSTNQVRAGSTDIMSIPELKDGFVTLTVTLDFGSGNVYYYNGNGELIHTQTVSALTPALKANLHTTVPLALVCNNTNGQRQTVLIDKIKIYEGEIA